MQSHYINTYGNCEPVDTIQEGVQKTEMSLQYKEVGRTQEGEVRRLTDPEVVPV